MSKPHKHSKGSTLLVALLLVSLLLVAGVGLLSRKGAQYARGNLEQDTAQAFLLAQSGAQDALLKLDKDQTFPPNGGEEQMTFVYSNDVLGLDGDSIGKYEVTIDSERAEADSFLLIIRSVGFVGEEANPRALHTVQLEIDLNPETPTFKHVISYQNLGS